MSLHYTCSYVKCSVLINLSFLQNLKLYAYLKILFKWCRSNYWHKYYFLVKSKSLNIDLFLSKRSIINPNINYKHSLHSHETEAVTKLRFKQCRDIESGVRNLSSYVYNRGFSFMVSIDTTLSGDILWDKNVIYIIS